MMATVSQQYQSDSREMVLRRTGLDRRDPDVKGPAALKQRVRARSAHAVAICVSGPTACSKSSIAGRYEIAAQMSV